MTGVQTCALPISTLLREREAGGAAKLRDKYLSLCSEDITERRLSHIDKLLEQAAKEFDEMCLIKERKRVGIVGEIYLKFNPYAHRNITEWLSSKNIEVAPPMLLDFFMQTFANRKINVAANMVRSSVYDYLYKLSYYLVNLEIKKADKICRGFKYYEPFENIFHSAVRSEGIVSGSAQFGEGWLLPSEIISYAERGKIGRASCRERVLRLV